MVILNCFKEKIEDLLKEEIEVFIEVLLNKDMGDYVFLCFKLVKVFRKVLNMIVSELVESIELSGEIIKVI